MRLRNQSAVRALLCNLASFASVSPGGRTSFLLSASRRLALILLRRLIVLLRPSWRSNVRNLSTRRFQDIVLFTRTSHLERAKEMNQIPRLLRLDVVCKRGHRSSVKPGHEVAINVGVGVTELQQTAGKKVKRLYRQIFAVGLRRGRFTVATAEVSVTQPTHKQHKQRLA